MSRSAGRPGDVVGIDVGARSLHGVRLGRDRRLVGARLFDAGDVEGVVRWAAGAAVGAVDGPDGPSRGLHAGDDGLAPKFRAARSGEVGLGRAHGLWVSWVTPIEIPGDTWMAAAVAVHAALAAAGTEAIEVYPHGAFRELAGGARLPTKQRAAGVLRRAEIVAGELAEPPPHLSMWAHDGLDAVACALVALDRAEGTAVASGPHDPRPGGRPSGGGPGPDDGSRIWLPRRRDH